MCCSKNQILDKLIQTLIDNKFNERFVILSNKKFKDNLKDKRICNYN